MINTLSEGGRLRTPARLWFIVWLAVWTIIGLGLAAARLSKVGGEAFAYVYGGVLLGGTGGAVYSWLWRRQAARLDGAPKVLVGCILGFLASLPYLAGQTAIEILLTRTPPGVWQDLGVVLVGCVIGAACAGVGRRLDVRHPTV